MFNDDHLFASQEDKTNSNGEMVLLNLDHTKDDTLLFILSKKSNKTLIVGNETISDNLGALLERQNIKYVSRNSTSAELDNAFENTFESESEEILSYITEKLGGDIKSLPQLVKGVKPSVLAKPIMFHKNTRG